jgi:hypothetical protein
VKSRKTLNVTIALSYVFVCSFPSQNPGAMTNIGNHSIFFSLKCENNPILAVHQLAYHLENKIKSETLIAIMIDDKRVKDFIKDALKNSSLKERVSLFQSIPGFDLYFC